MGLYVAKVALTALIVIAVSEVARRSTFWAAALASLPLTSLLAFVWIYVETGDTERVAAMAQGVLWLVLPSLVFFVVLPLLLRGGVSFWPSLVLSSVGTAAAYFVTVRALEGFGIRIS
jgi:hypothetical protein